MIGIKVKYVVLQPNFVLWHGFNLFNLEGSNVFDSHSVNLEWYERAHDVGNFELIVWIPNHLLNEGSYYLNFAIFNHNNRVIHLHEKSVVFFNVYDDLLEKTLTARGASKGAFPGIVRPLLKWEML